MGGAPQILGSESGDILLTHFVIPVHLCWMILRPIPVIRSICLMERPSAFNRRRWAYRSSRPHSESDDRQSSPKSLAAKRKAAASLILLRRWRSIWRMKSDRPVEVDLSTSPCILGSIFGLAVRPWSTLGRGSYPRHFMFNEPPPSNHLTLNHLIGSTFTYSESNAPTGYSRI